MAEPPKDIAPDTEQPFAALDLGSNSFHLIVVTERSGHIKVVDKHKEMVRLAENLGEGNELAPATTQRALECLERFGQRVRHLPISNVRVVGTNALRGADNSDEFIALAERVLGHRVEIISGYEEARLIYLGVSHSLEDNHDSRLVVDIGGGSTELILGRQFQPHLMESLEMGCVFLSQKCFGDRNINPLQFGAAVDFARQELEGVKKNFLERGWATAIGASGTILAINKIIASELGDADITRSGLEHVIKRLLDSKRVENLDFRAVSAERALVLPGGIAILKAIFESLEISRMTVGQGALREGLIQDLLGRVHDKDIRETTVRNLLKRHHADEIHASRVSSTALLFMEQVAVNWELTDPTLRQLLRWAAVLHEIGMDISHSRYHKHGAYLLDHMDLPGFSRSEQHALSLLVRAHRRRFAIDGFGADVKMIRLAVLLRLSVVLHRGRTDAQIDPRITVQSDAVTLEFPQRWLEEHRLTELDLKQEIEYLTEVPIKLLLATRDSSRSAH